MYSTKYIKTEYIYKLAVIHLTFKKLITPANDLGTLNIKYRLKIEFLYI